MKKLNKKIPFDDNTIIMLASYSNSGSYCEQPYSGSASGGSRDRYTSGSNYYTYYQMRPGASK